MTGNQDFMNTPRARFSRTNKIILLAAGIITILCIGGALIVNYATRDLCSNQVFQEVQSPDSAYRAVVFQRDCGETTGFSTEVSLLPAGQALSDKASGNVLDLDGADGALLKIDWTGARAVTITYFEDVAVFDHQGKYKDGSTMIEISYAVVPRP
jgi:hypothetical protein